MKMKMKIFSTKPKQEKTVVFDHMGKRSWRWVADINPFYFTLSQELSCEKSPLWCFTHQYFEIGFEKSFEFGRFHFWYDGPHDNFRFGPFYMSWSLGPCQKCENTVK